MGSSKANHLQQRFEVGRSAEALGGCHQELRMGKWWYEIGACPHYETELNIQMGTRIGHGRTGSVLRGLATSSSVVTDT
jgi:hypothetical protein